MTISLIQKCSKEKLRTAVSVEHALDFQKYHHILDPHVRAYIHSRVWASHHHLARDKAWVWISY